eukprot:TRINITY_DN16798_c0_g1_i11.p1 TRINITY_DN16798_c0_g1~~TRINITY_DN16798_c0_g1_i11.p1  ORF type:complete len:125 (-),score=16.94 TRINITY_DN16798_c0_g1_i11:98-472(-)
MAYNQRIIYYLKTQSHMQCNTNMLHVQYQHTIILTVPQKVRSKKGATRSPDGRQAGCPEEGRKEGGRTAAPAPSSFTGDKCARDGHSRVGAHQPLQEVSPHQDLNQSAAPSSLSSHSRCLHTRT